MLIAERESISGKQESDLGCVPLWLREGTTEHAKRWSFFIVVSRNRLGDLAAGGSQGEAGFDQQVDRDARVALLHLGDHIRKRQAVCGAGPQARGSAFGSPITLPAPGASIAS